MKMHLSQSTFSEQHHAAPIWALIVLLVFMFVSLYDPFRALGLTSISLKPELRKRIPRFYCENAERWAGISLFFFGPLVFMAILWHNLWFVVAISASPFV